MIKSFTCRDTEVFFGGKRIPRFVAFEATAMRKLQELHAALASTLIACAGLHALAAIVMGRIERTNLVRAMFTGVKIRPQRDDQSRSF